MSLQFNCGSEEAQAALTAYLYGDCDAAERAAVEAHLAICAACASELAALGATRSALASWTPPDAELGFRIVSDRPADAGPGTVLRPARWWTRPLPAWAQAAAAVVIFAAGALLGMRAGASGPVSDAPTVASAPAGPAVSTVSAQDLAALEGRLRREMTAIRSASAAAPAAQAGATDEGRILQRVRALLEESERRQERQMAIRLAQVLRDVDMQRRIDLARIEQTFGQMEGVTGAELLQQREAINYLRRVSSQRPQ